MLPKNGLWWGLPMTRIALISDIHSNVVALRAVLEDIQRARVDQVICLGDVANLGPEPNLVIEILAGLGCPCIMGNHDEFLLEPALVHSYASRSPQIVASVDWSRSKLSSSELDFIRGFERDREFDLGVTSKLYVFHGSPRSNVEGVLATTPPDTLDEMLAGASATVMAGGHTHIQMLRQHHGHLLVNPGSVGLAFKDYVRLGSGTILGHAEYAVVEEAAGTIGVSLRRVPLDKDELRRTHMQSDHPLRDYLLSQYS
jgi:predicted phosphodiesterase